MVAVIIPNLDSPLIAEVIAALDAQTARAQIAEILVVGRDTIGRVPPHVQFIDTGHPVAAARARNLGAAHARSEYLLFVDSDCILDPDFLTHIQARHAAGAAVVGGAVRLEPRPYWVACDNAVTFAGVLTDDAPGARAYLPSFAFSVRRADFLAVGGFDERFPAAGGEDQDLCYRLAARGVACVFAPAATVAHRPARATAAAVWRHLHSYGRSHVGVVAAHPQAARTRLSARLVPLAGLLRVLAPLLALADMLRRPLRPWLLPGMIWARTAWYWGVADGIQVRHT